MAARRLPMLFLSLAVAALLTPRAMAEGDQGCDEGWTQSGSRCFKFFSDKKLWNDAEKSCHLLSANLASIHSEAQNSLIVDLIVKATGENTYTWLGGTDAAEEGKWQWSDGTVWDFNRWGPGEPNDVGGNEHWLMINFKPTLWNDLPNSWSLSYVCAKDVPEPTSEPTPDLSPEPIPKPRDVSLTLEGFVCHCTPQSK